MVCKKHLIGINNYCKTAHTMKVTGVSKIYINKTSSNFLNCLNSNCFEIEKIRPDFMYSKWLTKE